MFAEMMRLPDRVKDAAREALLSTDSRARRAASRSMHLGARRRLTEALAAALVAAPDEDLQIVMRSRLLEVTRRLGGEGLLERDPVWDYSFASDILLAQRIAWRVIGDAHSIAEGHAFPEFTEAVGRRMLATPATARIIDSALLLGHHASKQGARDLIDERDALFTGTSTGHPRDPGESTQHFFGRWLAEQVAAADDAMLLSYDPRWTTDVDSAASVIEVAILPLGELLATQLLMATDRPVDDQITSGNRATRARWSRISRAIAALALTAYRLLPSEPATHEHGDDLVL